jgi:hypothetical protein
VKGISGGSDMAAFVAAVANSHTTEHSPSTTMVTKRMQVHLRTVMHAEDVGVTCRRNTTFRC